MLDSNSELIKAALKERVYLVLWHRGEHLILVRDCERDGAWRLPGTAVAQDETLKQAAQRAALLDLDLELDMSRFGDVFRERVSQTGLVLRSLKATLEDDEFAELPDFNLIGNREIRAIHKREIKQYLPRKADRRIMS